MNYFEFIIVVSLFCLGLRAITHDGMIGEPIRQWFLEKAPYWGKPIVLCVTCMSSFWGTVIFWGNIGITNTTLATVFSWAGISISCAFVNSVLWEYYQSINTCKK